MRQREFPAGPARAALVFEGGPELRAPLASNVVQRRPRRGFLAAACRWQRAARSGAPRELSIFSVNTHVHARDARVGAERAGAEVTEDERAPEERHVLHEIRP